MSTQTETASLTHRWHALIALLSCWLICHSWAGEPGFSISLTPGLIESYSVKFGADAKSHLVAWQQFSLSLKGQESRREPRARKSDEETLEAVNEFFNQVPFMSDYQHWGVTDYWATPAELLASYAGDCEDFSIAKYFALKEGGIPISRLRITYVKSIKLKLAHMVLAYYRTPDAEPLILDNLTNEILPASQRNDLVPVYSFNDEDLWMAGNRMGAGNPTQIRMWRVLLDKLEAERRL